MSFLLLPQQVAVMWRLRLHERWACGCPGEKLSCRWLQKGQLPRSGAGAEPDMCGCRAVAVPVLGEGWPSFRRLPAPLVCGPLSIFRKHGIPPGPFVPPSLYAPQSWWGFAGLHWVLPGTPRCCPNSRPRLENPFCHVSCICAVPGGWGRHVRGGHHSAYGTLLRRICYSFICEISRHVFLNPLFFCSVF